MAQMYLILLVQAMSVHLLMDMALPQAALLILRIIGIPKRLDKAMVSTGATTRILLQKQPLHYKVVCYQAFQVMLLGALSVAHLILILMRFLHQHRVLFQVVWQGLLLAAQ